MAHGMLLGLTILLLAACGGSDSSGPQQVSQAPVLSNLRLTQTTQGSGGTVRIEADVFDSDADLFGGQCVIDTVNFGRATAPISGLPPGFQPGSDPRVTNATVSCTARYQGHGVTVVGEYYVFDRAGHESNHLSFTFLSEARRE